MPFMSLTTSVKSLSEGPRDFSVVLGGPLFQLYRRLHLSGDMLELPVRRTVAVALLAWAPLLLLSIFEGTAWGGVKEPFLLDTDVNARLLVALPLLVGSELFVHGRVAIAARQFITRGIVAGDALATFELASSRAIRLRESAIAEVLLVVFVYAVGISVLRDQFAPLTVDAWFRRVSAGAHHITAAGWWYKLVSLPLFQFILFRWYFRLAIWATFLSRVAGCGLKLVPTHPDRAAGLGFLADSTVALVPFLFAHGTLFAGVMAAGIFFEGRTLLSYGPPLASFSLFAIAVALAPLLAFAPPLARARRAGLREYGALAQSYVTKFESKWLRTASPDKSQFLGTADIQSLSDMINSFQATVADMRLIPISLRSVVRLAIVTMLPVSPLLLTVMPASEILRAILKGLF